MKKCVEGMIITFVDDMKAGRGTNALVFKKALDTRIMDQSEIKEKCALYTKGLKQMVQI